MADFDLIIVGAGPAGMTAAIYGARANLKVLLLDKLAPGGQVINTNEVENYPAVGKMSGAELAYQMFQHTQQFEDITFDYRTVLRIEDADGEKRVVCKEQDKVFTAKAVIVATGTKPRTLGIPGEKELSARGISWCAICDGAQYKGQEVVVIGGGNSAVEESIYLAGITTKLTVVTLFDLTADPSASEKLRAMPNVTVYPYQEVLSFEKDEKGKLAGVKFKSTKDGEERFVKADGVFEYIGLEPVTECVKELGITDKYGYVEVDAHMATKIPGIWAAGDCTNKFLRQIVTATSDGAVAANAAAGYIHKL